MGAGPIIVTGVVASLALVALALMVARYKRLALERDLVVATARALLQLTAVAALIHLVLAQLGFAVLFVLTMFAAATFTSARRLTGVRSALVVSATAIMIGSSVALAVLFASGAFALEPRFVIPTSGIIIGGAMVATSLAGGRLRDDLLEAAPEIEARLALGVDMAFALRDHVRRAVVGALVPVIDQTRNVGVITLPGAFVGMILGGASPTQAALVQLTVLFSLLGAETLSATAAAMLVSRAFTAPGERLRAVGD